MGEGHTVMLRSRGTRARRSQLLLLCQKRPRTLAGPRVLHAFGEPTPQAFRISPSSPAAHAGTGEDFAPFDFAYTTRPNPPSIGAFEP
jgi:hypothetical protein